MIKVLHLNGAKGWGGNEQQLVDTIYSFPKGKVKNLIYCIKGSKLAEVLKENPDVDLIHPVIDNYKSSKNRKHLKQVVENKRVDVIHIHTSNALTLFFFTSLFYKLNVKVVFSKKGMGSSMSFLSKIKYNFKGIDKIICISNYVLEAMKDDVIYDRNYAKLVVISDGVLESRISNSRASAKMHVNARGIQLLNLANHTQAKDLEVLIEAIRYLVYDLDYKDFFLHQFGSFTKLTPSLKKMIDDYNLNDYIKLYGFVDQASNFYKQSDIFVMSSKKEGGPSSVIEAMSQKTPIVSTNVGVVPEAIESLENGIVVPVKDYEAFANGILKLSNDKRMRSSFAQKSYDIYLQHFTAQSTALKTLQLYEGLLSI